MSTTFLLGIDGGGTRCRARVRDQDGGVRAEAEGGLANVYQDFDAAIHTIAHTASTAADLAGIAVEQLHAGLGLAGVVGPESERAVAQAGLPFATVTVASDGHAACLGAHGGRDGGIVIAGTGSAGFAIVNGESHALGAMGFALGDDGSGAAIGRLILRRAALALDGMAEPTPLLDAILDDFGRDKGRFLVWSQTALSRDYAAYAPRAFEAARGGDVHAAEALGQAAQGVEDLCRALLARGARRLCLIGAVANALKPWLPQDVLGHVGEPLADPADGAIMMARRAAGLPDLPR